MKTDKKFMLTSSFFLEKLSSRLQAGSSFKLRKPTEKCSRKVMGKVISCVEFFQFSSRNFSRTSALPCSVRRLNKRHQSSATVLAHSSRLICQPDPSFAGKISSRRGRPDKVYLYISIGQNKSVTLLALL